MANMTLCPFPASLLAESEYSRYLPDLLCCRRRILLDVLRVATDKSGGGQTKTEGDMLTVMVAVMEYL